MSNVLRAKLKKLARSDKKTERQKPKEGGTKRGKGVPASPPEPSANVSLKTHTHTDPMNLVIVKVIE